MIRILSAGFVSLSLSSWDGVPAAAEEADLSLAEDEDEDDIFESLIMFFFYTFWHLTKGFCREVDICWVFLL